VPSKIRWAFRTDSTGLSDGTGYELVSTTVVPVPAALPLFISGLLGISFYVRKIKRSA
jgi:hypothetical protein